MVAITRAGFRAWNWLQIIIIYYGLPRSLKVRLDRFWSCGLDIVDSIYKCPWGL